MICLFLPPEQLTSDQINIIGDQARHLALVLKSQPGDTVTVFDGNGSKYECRLTVVRKKEVLAEIISKEPYSTESPASITLAQGLPKGDKMDFIIQKSTELGVRRIIPLITERSQVRHTHKTGRWRKIAISASQQSGRDKVPEVGEPAALENYLDEIIPPAARGYIEDIKGVKLDAGTCIILSEEYKKRNLKQALTSADDTSLITILVGPEGGFSKEEVSAAVEKGFIEVSLGPRILRTETASIAAISIIQYELGDAG
jgi:16S rRNA (uracil1498-N3)-methyltransferase